MSAVGRIETSKDITLAVKLTPLILRSGQEKYGSLGRKKRSHVPIPDINATIDLPLRRYDHADIARYV